MKGVGVSNWDGRSVAGPGNSVRRPGGRVPKKEAGGKARMGGTRML